MSDWREDYENNGAGVDPNDYDNEDDFMDSLRNNQRRMEEEENQFRDNRNSQGCYIATCVYGSYDCPEVWTLRRYRDYILAAKPTGRLFIRLYYFAAPIAVRLFGEKAGFRNFFRKRLDKKVKALNDEGIADTPYQDRPW